MLCGIGCGIPNSSTNFCWKCSLDFWLIGYALFLYVYEILSDCTYAEQATKGVLVELLARYGKVLDREKEDKRLGMIHEEFAMAIVGDYKLPITPGCFSQEIMPMYYEKYNSISFFPMYQVFLLFFTCSIKIGMIKII